MRALLPEEGNSDASESSVVAVVPVCWAMRRTIRRRTIYNASSSSYRIRRRKSCAVRDAMTARPNRRTNPFFLRIWSKSSIHSASDKGIRVEDSSVYAIGWHQPRPLERRLHALVSPVNPKYICFRSRSMTGGVTWRTSALKLYSECCAACH